MRSSPRVRPGRTVPRRADLRAASLAAAFGLGVVLASANITDVPRSLLVAVLVWVCFTVAIELPAFALERAPRRFAIGAGHELLVYLAIAVVFGLGR